MHDAKESIFADEDKRSEIRIRGGEEHKMSGQNSGKRILVYDWLRLIATILVVIGHSAYLSMQTTYGGVMYELPQNLNDMYNSAILRWMRGCTIWIYGFHMPLFFMLSGAVLALKPIADLDAVIKSKVKRLLIPYFVYGWLFMLPIKRIGHFYTNDSLKQAMNGFLSGVDSGHLWFLTAVFWCIIVFVLIYKVLSKLKISSIYLMLLMAGVIQLTYPYIPFDILGLKTGLSYIFYFALGFVFENERKKYTPWNLKETVTAFTILVLIEILNIKCTILNGFFAIIVGAFMTYIFADLCSRLLRKISDQKMWTVMIRNLFYVYLFHDPLEYIVLRIFMDRNLLASAAGCVMYTLCRTLFVFLISLLLGECVGKMKKVFNKIFKNVEGVS